jgi:hypothetical protein
MDNMVDNPLYAPPDNGNAADAEAANALDANEDSSSHTVNGYIAIENGKVTSGTCSRNDAILYNL